MKKGAKVGRNQPCPCGAGQKYKRCCRGRVDWESIISGDDPAVLVSHLSARGKNILFLNHLADALQLDHRSPVDSQQFKRAFTPEAVKKIFEGVSLIWCDGTDVKRVLQQEREATSGLYVGMYDPRLILRGLTRHSLYSERLLLIDPFMNPMIIREEYNPLVHPELHRSTTLRWAWLWLTMAPWIRADLVHFIRTPGDFDMALEATAEKISLARHERHPELRELGEKQLLDSDELLNSYKRQIMLGMPDAYYRQIAAKYGHSSPEAIAKFLDAVRRMRASDPLVLEPSRKDSHTELLQMFSGASYEMAKWTAELSGSHLITDIEARWAEIQVDRQEAGVQDDIWTPFAKAFTNVPFNFLNDVPIDVALRLRKEDRLADLRSCLGRAWRACRDPDEFSAGNADALALELMDQIRLAEAEWEEIKGSLAKLIGAEAGVGLLGVGGAIQAGFAHWAAAGAVVTVATGALVHRFKKRAFTKRHPASFFLSLSK